MLVLAGCDTASQEVEPVISPDGYPVATFTTDFEGTAVTEGDSIVYVITTNKMLDRSVTFQVTQTGGDADGHDFVYEPAVLQPYTTEVVLKIFFPAEDIVEAGETITLEVAPTALADKYLLNPSTSMPSLDLSITNYNDPTLLTINFDWDDDNDNDFGILSDTDDYPETWWSLNGATTAKPEIDKSIWLSDPAGTYYVSVWDWGNPSMNYTFTFGHPDGSMQVIEGYFDVNDLGGYVSDLYSPSYPPLYRIIKVVNDGSKFTVTAL